MINNNCLYLQPFSEISFDGIAELHSSPEVSKFHRSFSMGHGWRTKLNNNVWQGGDADPTRPNGNSGAPPTDTVIKRRKNRSSCEEDIGSLLLCNPSTSLRSLVPKEVLDLTTSPRVDDNRGELIFIS